MFPPVREENARPFVVAQTPLPAASSGPVPRSVGRYSQQFGRLYVCVPVASHGPCPWVGRDKSRLADFDGGVKVFPDPSTWALMLLGFAGLGYAGYRRARRASVVGRRRLT